MKKIYKITDGMAISSVIALWTFVLTLVIGGVIGYIRNIIHLLEAAGDPINMIEILRLIGVIVGPLGMVMGWMY